MCSIITKRPYTSMTMSAPRPVSPEDDNSASSASVPVTRTASLPLKKRRRLDLDLTFDTATTVPSSTPVVSAPEKKKKTKKSVSFAPNADVRAVPKWTPEEYAASWYSGIDIALFKIQEGTDAALLRCLISAAPCIENLPQDSSVYRGLERLLSQQITAEIKARRRLVVKSVLIEQALQRGQQQLQGAKVLVMDVNRIAAVSRCCSENGAVWARTLGNL